MIPEWTVISRHPLSIALMGMLCRIAMNGKHRITIETSVRQLVMTVSATVALVPVADKFGIAESYSQLIYLGIGICHAELLAIFRVFVIDRVRIWLYGNKKTEDE